MARCATKDIVELMSDPCFYRLRTVVDRGLLLFEDLDGYELPEGYTKEEIWLILTAIRKQAAIFVPDDPYRSADCWFVTTSVLSFDSKMLEMQCMAGFPLDEALASLKGSPFVTRFIERTLARALETEGICVPDERIHEIFLGSPACNDIERVVGNYFEVSSDADSLARYEVSHGLIETLYYRLTEGVDADAIPRRPDVCPLDERISPPTSAAAIDAVCRRSRQDDEEFRFGPVLRIVNASWFFWNFDVFPCLNSLVGVLLRNVMAIKWGYPVLSWLPVGYYPFGELNTPRMKAVFDNWSIDYGFGFDFTSYFTTYIKLYLEELDRLKASVEQLRRLNDLIGRTFGADLNDRQKSILSALCREPDALLRIASHQRTFKVAYATARNDFLELERKGYLVKGRQGKAFVFQACSELREKIVSLGEVASGAR
ncbi:hypothetical protein [Rubneribacter sp.]|nr:hypothetical protein [Candidatus Rubneribacter avistercoris]